MATSHWPAFWHFAPGWGCIPVGIPTISSHGMILHSWPYSVTSWNITPFINSLPYSFIITCGLTTFFNWDNRDFQHNDQRVPIHLAVRCSTSHHPRPRCCLKQSKRQPLCSMEPLSIRTSTGSAASHHGLPAKHIESDACIYIYIYIWYPPQRPTIFDLPIYIYIYIHIYMCIYIYTYCELKVSHQPCWFVMDYN